jgi:hypothetical protein
MDGVSVQHNIMHLQVGVWGGGPGHTAQTNRAVRIIASISVCTQQLDDTQQWLSERVKELPNVFIGWCTRT